MFCYKNKKKQQETKYAWPKSAPWPSADELCIVTWLSRQEINSLITRQVKIPQTLHFAGTDVATI